MWQEVAWPVLRIAPFGRKGSLKSTGLQPAQEVWRRHILTRSLRGVPAADQSRPLLGGRHPALKGTATSGGG